MKKRFVTMTIVGAMAVAAMAPATVFAATGQTNVTYITGAVAPGGQDSGYYVTIPADIMFTDDVKSATQELELVKMEDVVLPANLSVGVTVTSQNLGYLKDSAATPNQLAYSVAYSTGTPSGATVTAGTGTLNTTTPTDVSVATFTGEGTFEATATLAQTAAEASLTVEKGTQFTDVLTYTITDNTPGA